MGLRGKGEMRVEGFVELNGKMKIKAGQQDLAKKKSKMRGGAKKEFPEGYNLCCT